MNSRRKFILQSGLAATTVLLGNGKVRGVTRGNFDGTNKKANKKEESLKIGIAGYSFLNFNLQQSLAMMQRMNVKYLCIKDFHLPLDSSNQQIDHFHQELRDAGVTGHSVGPIYMKSREDIDKAFIYAKRVGVNLIVGIPDVKDLPYVSEKCKEFDMFYGIHNHGPQDKVYPNASVVYNYVKDLDHRLGLCLDMGHDMRDSADPIKDLSNYRDRVFDLHLKDVTKASADGTTCELGRGVINIPLFIRTLNEIGYKGMCNLEFEKDMKDPLPGMAESVGYFKGAANSLGVSVI